MENIAYLIKDLRSRGIGVTLSGDDLEISQLKEEIDTDTINLIRNNKERLVNYLRSFSSQDSFSEIPNAPSLSSYPISDAQRRLWVLSQFEEGTVAYNMPSRIVLNGDYNIEMFKQAIQAAIDRHEILRTVFKENSAGVVHQHILTPEALNFKVDYKDFRILGNESAAAIDLYIEEDKQLKFDLENGPLIRASLLQMTDDSYTFYYNMHHIISDGWSMKVLSNDVLAFYNHYVNKTPLELSELRIQYKDYSAWQLSQLETASYKASKEYWNDLLSGSISTIDLPSTKKRPLFKTNRGQKISTFVSKDTTSKLKLYCNQQGGTPFMGLLSALNVLIYRYTNTNNIVIGSPIAGREHVELKNQIGFYTNTLALRNELNPSDSFNSVFNLVKQNTLNAYTHQSYPFDRLVEDLQVKHNTSRNSFFDIMMVFQNFDHDTADFDWKEEKEKEIVDLGVSSPKFDIDITFEIVGGHLKIDLEYNTDVYEYEVIAKFVNHFKQLLKNIFDQPEKEISKIELLSEKEKQEQLYESNDTKAVYPKGENIISLFEAQVKKTPNKTAVIYKDIKLTYSDLEEKSDAYAVYLTSMFNVKYGDRIVVTLPHDEHLLAVLLAVKKTGAIYVPIDLETPQSRIDFIKEDSESTIVIDENLLLEMNAFENKGRKFVKPQPTYDNEIEFLIYTSGSTGIPKGILIKSESVCNRLYWMWNNYPFQETEICCAKTSISFVDHIWELYGPLLKGIPSAFFKKSEILDIRGFIKSLQENKVTRIVLVPSLLRALLAHPALCKEELKLLNVWISSGASLKKSDVQHFYAVHQRGDVRLLNIYGSTEVTADATYYDTYEDYNHYKDFKLFEYTSDDKIEALISQHDVASKIVSEDYQSLLDLKNFKDVGLDSQYNPDAYLKFVETEVIPNVVNVSKPSFIGHMTSPIPKIIREMNALIVALNQNQVKIETSMVATLIEKQVIGIFHNLVYANDLKFYDDFVQNADQALGVITNGGTMSNLMAINYSLNNLLGPKEGFSGIKKEGLLAALRAYDYDRVVLLGSDWCHYSFGKALKLLGLGTDAFISIDYEGKEAAALETEIVSLIAKLREEKCLILGLVGIAGTTESGNIDPLEILGKIANHHNIHYHVDAAFGGSFLTDDTLKLKMKGIELADSVSICAHKQLYIPIGLSVCVFKDPNFVNSSENNTHYQARKGSYDLGKYTIEGSKNFMSFALHAVFKIFGKEGFAQVIRHNYATAQFFAQAIDKHPDFDLVFKPDLNIVLYRYLPKKYRGKESLSNEDLEQINEINLKIQKEQFKQGNSFVSYTQIKKRENEQRHLLFRTVFMNPYTTKEDLLSLLEEQVTIAATIENRLYESHSSVQNESIFIGKPIENVKVYILDEFLNVLPAGVVGEICISGECVSAGYTNTVEDFAAKFIENPFLKGERLFRTGDLGRKWEDGNIEFVGRKDHQIKIRGNRVELGEIENTLCKRKEISQAVITVIENGVSQENELAAYIISSQKEEVMDLRASLKKSLPEYMIPSYFVQLEKFPVLTNGKIDLKALPDPLTEGISTKVAYVAPRNAIEKELVSIWQEVLDKEKVGVLDDFFELGGHSIKGTKLLSQINRAFNVEINIKNLFMSPTIECLAAQIKFIETQEQIKSEKESLTEIEL
ncbi:aminotransferase class V-fold PLP-dependent enzyme [Flavobacterium sp. UGB4466]|uniref:aminotransferase class V-fold PLP-dependent enzyme n=1 Tax=Flavobacterium sp. UGB4466 TaxID=2730889 RepID=UPI00192B4530|nr:aminotransferase class V-fold PLP-dependent enzyme [Flavobacterium sp. UGB4466]